jgi:hypothetical protein
MDPSSIIFIVFMGVVVIVYFIFSGRGRRAGRNVCTRCSGTGEVNEKWPDPNAPGGWHRVEGVCPKCKGKGRVN